MGNHPDVRHAPQLHQVGPLDANDACVSKDETRPADALAIASAALHQRVPVAMQPQEQEQQQQQQPVDRGEEIPHSASTSTPTTSTHTPSTPTTPTRPTTPTTPTNTLPDTEAKVGRGARGGGRGELA
eukprot:CAMPEP_0173082558 /NCGR_PEP_ID=MMETSP1102-20130122/18394_1 /TAXON_ID=49646 /ORGANISM="Geminigera sp., Strain Caron Lab Isolate" /LENGTH=127 /DNA_ID=CAMNT_0013958261 /DNA_START=171 /DNA_END=550 /DNA_ORIENTATION=+